MNGKTTVLFCESSIRNLKHLCRELNVEDTPDRDAAEREILLRGYERWGAGIVHHLYGGFSFALREENGRLFCARDAFGIENFYYCNLPDGRLLCAPNLSGITSDPGYRKAIDPEALQIYTIFGYPAGERTLWRGIRKLMPGCTLTRDKDPPQSVVGTALRSTRSMAYPSRNGPIESAIRWRKSWRRIACPQVSQAEARSFPEEWIPRFSWQPPGSGEPLP